jgi:FMN hydrolase / 5-amino-6-(5-phospho-D-ribitylamino)uracil phosphatase
MPSEQSIRVVFFDLDDTLCDTIGTREARARRAFDHLCRMESGLDAGALVRRALEPLAEPRSALGVRGLLAELGLLDKAAGMAALDAIRDYFEPLCLFEGVKETLEELSSGYELGVITNWESEDEQRRKVRHLGLDSTFRYFVVSAGAGYEKPDPRIFAHALSLVGAEPAEAVFIGDRLDVDVGGAKAAGMHAVWFNHWGGKLDGALPAPDALIERFRELPETITRIAGSSSYTPTSRSWGRGIHRGPGAA